MGCCKHRKPALLSLSIKSSQICYQFIGGELTSSVVVLLLMMGSLSDGASVPITTTTSSTQESAASASSSLPPPLPPSPSLLLLMPQQPQININSDHDQTTTHPDNDILESLAASRILMDYHKEAGDVLMSMSSENRIGKAESKTSIISSTTTTTTSTTASSLLTSGSTTTTTTTTIENKVNSSLPDSLSPKRLPITTTSTMSSSPLNVARCRATCIAKLKPSQQYSAASAATASATSPSSTQTTSQSFSPNPQETSTLADKLQHLPILRSKRFAKFPQLSKISAKSTGSSWSCLLNSPHCCTCWQSCQLLDAKDLTTTTSTKKTTSPKVSVAGNAEKQLGCATDQKCRTQPGCQVACSFYQSLPQTLGESGDPLAVLATKHESVVKIAPGKITWPATASSVVYMVIQEYPDRKWRQIAQTTEPEIEIPTELTTSKASTAKLNSIRVLVVSKNGLLSVYNPVKLGQTPFVSKSNHIATATTNTTTSSLSSNKTAAENATDSNDTTHVTPIPTQPQNSGVPSTQTFGSKTATSDNDLQLTTTVTAPTTPATPFELRVVSLIHQKSLVIAELRWDPIGSNPEQDYLITWELAGGGLKGHLVTDSTSVTLSLWPDTTYQIHVQKFEENWDSDNATDHSPENSPKSYPLTVDTSQASFPMEQPSALIDQDSEDDYENEENLMDDNRQPEKVSMALGIISPPDHNLMQGHQKSLTSSGITHTGFLNMTLLLGISISALLFVLVILTVAAFTWTRMRAIANQYAGQEEAANLEYCSSSPMITPTKYPRLGAEYLQHNDCYDYSEEGSRRGCYSDMAMEPQPLLYGQQEDSAWADEQCHYHHHQYHNHRQQQRCHHHCDGSCCSQRNSIRCVFETSPQNTLDKTSRLAVISDGASDLALPPVSPKGFGYLSRGNATLNYLSFYGGDGGGNNGYSLLEESSATTTLGGGSSSSGRTETRHCNCR